MLLVKLGDEYRPVAAALFYGALRVSEALALTWADVDFAGASLTVRGTKSEASWAAIPLLSPLAEHLRAHRERQAAKGFERIGPPALVFQSATAAAAPAQRSPRGAERGGCSRTQRRRPGAGRLPRPAALLRSVRVLARDDPGRGRAAAPPLRPGDHAQHLRGARRGERGGAGGEARSGVEAHPLVAGTREHRGAPGPMPPRCRVAIARGCRVARRAALRRRSFASRRGRTRTSRARGSRRRCSSRPTRAAVAGSPRR